MRLADRRVLVTGAASGIGLAVSRLFARKGARVAMLDRDAPRLSKEAASVDRAVALVCDVGDEPAVRRAVADAGSRLGGLDGVVNCAAKAGLVMFGKTLAMDLAPYGIRVNAICPGIIDTPMFRGSWEDAPDPQAELAKILDRYLIRRTGQPEEIAYAALYLTSDESSFVTGTALAVDGGRTFH